MSLLATRAAELSSAQSIVQRCKAAGRGLTPNERITVEQHIKNVDDLDAQIKEADSHAALLKRIGRINPDLADFPDTSSSEVFSEAARSGIVQAVKSRTLFRTEVDRKSITTGTLLPSSGTAVEGGLWPNLFPIASLFRQQAANGPTVRYYRMDGATADIVAEGATKPDSGVTVTPVDVTLAKIATLASFSDEMVEDAGYLVAHLQAELTNAVITRENAAILATFAATSGVMTKTGVLGAVVDLVADSISGQEAVTGNTPSAIIAHPNVVASIRKSVDLQAKYQVDPLSSAPSSLHGVRIVSTPATAAGSLWVVGGQGTLIYRRGPITAEIGYNDTDFSKNMRTMRVEQRMATAVVRPASLTKVTLT